jgi:hypothetical protein
VTAALAADATDAPIAFFAVTVNLYGVSSFSAETTHDLRDEVEQVRPPGTEVTVYEVAPIEPAQDTVTKPSAGTAATPVGAIGTVTAFAGVTALLATETGDDPATFMAITVKV